MSELLTEREAAAQLRLCERSLRSLNYFRECQKYPLTANERRGNHYLSTRGSAPLKRNSPMTNQTDYSTWTARDVASMTDLDLYGVRAEADLRSAAAEKAVAKARKALAKASAALAEANGIHEAVFAEQAREWAAERRAA